MKKVDYFSYTHRYLTGQRQCRSVKFIICAVGKLDKTIGPIQLELVGYVGAVVFNGFFTQIQLLGNLQGGQAKRDFL